jgi:hypothetical protein
MKRLIEIAPDVRESQIYRETLLAQPPEFFQRYYGFIPNLIEKIHLVEKTIQATMAPRVFANDVYRVKVRKSPPVVHLDLSRHDGEPITCWRDLQQIKNELVGPECEGVELFPAESRLVDTAHQYHIWVIEDSQFRFPFGYGARVVLPEPVRCQDYPDKMPSLDSERPLPMDHFESDHPSLKAC